MKQLKIIATTEQEFREQAYEIAKSVNTPEDLAEFVKFISNVPLDYGTVVYAQCAAMLAAQHVMNESEQGGITGFQAGFIGWEMVKKFMSVGDCGLTLIDWEKCFTPNINIGLKRPYHATSLRNCRQRQRNISQKQMKTRA